MRRILLVLGMGAMMAAMLGLSASPALADHLDDRDHSVFDDHDSVFDEHYSVFDDHREDIFDDHDHVDPFDDEDDDDGEGDWACIPVNADNFGPAFFDPAIFFVDGPTECPEGFRAQLVIGFNDDEDN